VYLPDGVHLPAAAAATPPSIATQAAVASIATPIDDARATARRWRTTVRALLRCDGGSTPAALQRAVPSESRTALCAEGFVERGDARSAGADAEAEALRWRKEAGRLSCLATGHGPTGGFCLCAA
jgi:hypothetical protein